MTTPDHGKNDGHALDAVTMTYSDYLDLPSILGAQKPLSTAHDEMLFIIQHQTTELWMKLAIHELGAARQAIKSGKLPQSFKMLSRISRIFEQLNSAWDVLRTMTPSEYTAFRKHLGRSSGFQSWQYRLIEFIVGNRSQALSRAQFHIAEHYQQLEAELNRPSLYDVVLGLLVEKGFELPDEVTKRQFSEPHVANEEVQRAWQTIYQQPDQHWELYQLAEKLVDVEDYFRRWRFNHVTTVERIIGAKRGTGGTSGVPYLRRMLDVVLFPELWQVRTVL